MTVNRDDILALLEPGPHSAADLAEWIGISRLQMNGVLGAMAKAGLIRRVGVQKLWALASYTGEAPGAPSYEERLERGESLPLRQPPARPKTTTIATDAAPSWWTQATRDGFTATAAQHQERMHASKFGSPTGSANIITADLERRLRADAKMRREAGK